MSRTVALSQGDDGRSDSLRVHTAFAARVVAALGLLGSACFGDCVRAEERSTSTVVASPRAVARLGEDLDLCIKGYADLTKRAGDKPLGLFLRDLWIADVPLEPIEAPQGEACTPVRFHLVRTAGNQAAWARILGRPLEREDRAAVAVGTAGREAFAGGGHVRIALFGGVKGAVLALVTLAMISLAIATFAKYNGMLRDYVVASAPTKGPFSLSRVQMALWLFQIATAFFLLWGATGVVPTITPGLLALMGISATATLGAGAVDQTKRQEAKNAAEKAAVAVTATAANVAAAEATRSPAVLDAATRALAQAQAAEAEARAAAALPPAENFLSDLLTGPSGYSVSRLQIVVWTLVLTVVFWAGVWRNLEMPTFDATLLLLLGISAGAYVGLKIPEKPA